MRDPGSIPTGTLMWHRDSPVGVVSLNWWPRCDWSLWSRLRQVSSQALTRLSCRQCDNPSWSHTALLSRFDGFNLAAGPPFGFTTDIVGCWGWALCRPVISLHSYTVPLVQWSTRLLPVMRDPGSIHRGVLMWDWDSPVSVISQQNCLMRLL
jgi:hypothetical protein